MSFVGFSTQHRSKYVSVYNQHQFYTLHRTNQPMGFGELTLFRVIPPTGHIYWNMAHYLFFIALPLIISNKN